MSKRAVDLMKEEMEMLGAVRLREVSAAGSGHDRAQARGEGLITTGASSEAMS
jgi:hypothetical protein